MEDELVPLSQAAAEVGMSAERLRQLIKAGDLPRHQIGRYFVLYRSEVARLKERGKLKRGPKPKSD